MRNVRAPKIFLLQSVSLESLLGGIADIHRVWDGCKDPFVCPKNIETLCRALKIDLATLEPLSDLLRVLKKCLKECPVSGSWDPDQALLVVERINFELEKIHSSLARTDEARTVHYVGGASLTSLWLANSCIHCEVSQAAKYCLLCSDWFCEGCFKVIHNRGNRRFHRSLDLIPCASEGCTRIAQLICVREDRALCANCYTYVYLPCVPLSDRELPARIDYAETLKKLREHGESSPDKDKDLGNDWFPFCDRFGVIYYYNFKSRESMRRSPISMFDDEDPVADESSDVSERVSKFSSRQFTSPFS